MAEAKKSSNASFLDMVKASFSISLTTLLVGTLILALILAQLIDNGSNAIAWVLVLVIFAGLVGTIARFFIAPGNAANWSAFLVGAIGSVFLSALSLGVGYKGADPFGDVFLQSLGIEATGSGSAIGVGLGVFAPGALLLGAISLIVCRWGRD